jgi:hypothetical protein
MTGARATAWLRPSSAALVAAFVLGSARGASAQAAPPAAHDDAAFDFMNVLAQAGLHDIDDERWNAYGQMTTIGQFHPGFSAAYSNVGGSNHSLTNGLEGSYTGTFTLFFGLRAWRGGEVYFVPEVIAEDPFSHLAGIGGAIQNFELQKTGSETPQIYRSRTFFRQTFGLGGATDAQDSNPMQLGSVIEKRRFVFTLGNFTILDVFDKNSVAGDPRETFLNMAFMTHASWDFPSDARGYSWGGAEELYWDDWAFRVARITPPVEPNQLAIDFRFWEYYGDEAEIEHDHTLFGQPGAVRLLGYRNRVDTGKFADAIAAYEANHAASAANCGSRFNYQSQNPNAPDLCYVRHANVKLGVGVSVEQHFTNTIGMFARAMYSDGQTEVDAFNAADRSVSVGVLAKGGAWRRAFDLAGVGFGMSWISSIHAQYLAMGGVDGFLGDGRLRQAAEGVTEAFYSVNLLRAIWLTADTQLLWNPGYNADRGPVAIFGGRVHAEF